MFELQVNKQISDNIRNVYFFLLSQPMIPIVEASNAEILFLVHLYCGYNKKIYIKMR